MMLPESEPVSAEIAELLELSPAGRGWAEQDEGPFHRDDEAVRRDIAEGRPGALLTRGVRLAYPDASPLDGAAVEIWHCDALGWYSGFPPPESSAAVAQPQCLRDFLEGVYCYCLRVEAYVGLLRDTYPPFQSEVARANWCLYDIWIGWRRCGDQGP